MMGMHRSGTSLIAKLLAQAGLFMGRDLTDTWESRFFLNRNEKILNAGGGGWANPQCVEPLLNHQALRQALLQELSLDVDSLCCLSFLGLVKYLKFRSLYKIEIPWGWKEPRTTLLLPIYLDLFPDAKIIHIYRNGVDVAASLSRREKTRIEQTILKKSATDKISAFRDEYSKEPSVSSLWHNYFASAKLRFHPIEKYRKFGVHPVTTLEQGYRLWQYYVNRYGHYKQKFKFTAMDIQYESFLEFPEDNLKKLCDYCDLPISKEKIEQLCRSIDPTRKYAFKQDPTCLEFYQTVKSDTAMKNLGYDHL